MKKHLYFLLSFLVFLTFFVSNAGAALISIEASGVVTGTNGQGDKRDYSITALGTETKGQDDLKPGTPTGFGLRGKFFFFGAAVDSHSIVDKAKDDNSETKSDITSASILFYVPFVPIVDISFGVGGGTREYKEIDNGKNVKVSLLTYQAAVVYPISLAKVFQLRVGVGYQGFTGKKTEVTNSSDGISLKTEFKPDYSVINLILGVGF